VQVVAVYLNCMKREKGHKEENTKSIRPTLKACISVIIGWIPLKLEMECFLPHGIFHSKNGAVLLRNYS